MQVTPQTEILSAKRLTVKRTDFSFGAAAGPVANWLLEIVDESGKTIRSFHDEGALPASLKWDGKDEDGWVANRGAAGTYRLTIKYADGKQEQATGKVSAGS